MLPRTLRQARLTRNISVLDLKHAGGGVRLPSKGQQHALASGSRSSGGSGSPALAGEPIRPYAVIDQIDFERRSRDRGSSLVA